jgi:TolA-binding protein
MECVKCEALLDDLRRGDLPARLEAEARSHLAGCPRCRAAHMRMLRADAESTPPQPALSKRTRTPSFLWNLLRPSPRGARPRSERARNGTLYGALVGLLGRLAMAPQVAMGSVMLLIVLVGLWSLPQLTRRHGPLYRSGADSVRVHRPNVETDTSAALADTTQSSAGSERGLESDSAAASTASAAQARAAGAPSSAPPTAAKGPTRKEVVASEKQAKRDFESAMQHYRARDYPLATAFLTRALGSLASSADQAQALLYLARAERAQGHCERALNSYGTLVRSHSAKVEARAALREAVACCDRLGQPARATQLLEQAKASVPLASTAQNILSQR